MTTSTRCEFCDKRGLPLLLVRDAIAPAGAGAPLAPSLPIELAPTAAHYTKRLLRSGYVNVYDEARRRWEAYFVTADGYFFKLLQTPGVTPVTPSKPFNCPNEAHRAVASCITISDPKNASKVWIGFSDVLWTDAVRRAHEDVAYRKRHMTEIDVKAALAGNYGSHRSVAQVDSTLAEYALPATRAKASFGWTPSTFVSRYGQAERLKQECETLRPGGLMVTLLDPVGIVQELAALMKRNAELFATSRPEDKMNLAASMAIDSIEEAIRTQAEHGEITAATKNADDQIIANPLGHWLSASTRARTESIQNVTQRELKSAADSAWKKYADKFDDVARQAWHAPFRKRLEVYDSVFIAPLARSHVAWMRSTTVASYFECNFDSHHPESGAVYTTVFLHCIASTEDKQACAQLYDEWLTGDIGDTRNILLRAMVLNQKVTADAVKKAASVNIDLRQIPWDSVFTVFTDSVQRLSQQVQNGLARVIVEVSGAIARMFGKIMDGSQGFRAAVMATGLISGHPIVVCDIAGTKRQFRAHLVRQLLRTSGQVISEKQMQRAVAAELRRLQINGVPMEGATTKRWILVADKEMIARMPSGLSPQKRAEWLARSLKTVEDVEALNLHRWRAVINEKVRLGVVTAILQALCLTKLYADKDNSLAHNKSEATGRVYAGLGTIAATTSEALGSALAGRAASLHFGQGLANTSASFMKLLGKAGGLAVGIYVAVLDVQAARREKEEGNKGMSVLYYSSAVVGGVLSFAMLCSSIGWLSAAALPFIGLLVLIVIGIGLIIECIKDNPIQDWMERCPWGKLSSQRYRDLATLEAELNQALK